MYPSMHLGRHPRPPGRQLLQQTVRMLLECILVTHNVKKIKGVNYKTGDVDSMCEQDLRLLKQGTSETTMLVSQKQLNFHYYPQTKFGTR